MGDTSLAALRPTGLMERFNIARNYVKFYNHLGVAARYSVPRSLVRNHSVEHVVFAALHEVLKCQPIMCVTLQDEGTLEPKWRRLETINLRRHVKTTIVDEKTGFDTWVEEALRIPFLHDAAEMKRPLWQLMIARQSSEGSNGAENSMSFRLGFFCHHAIADGLSAGAFHLTFLDALNNLIAEKSNLFIGNQQISTYIVPKVSLLPTAEMKTNLSLGIFFVVKKVFNAFVYSPTDPLEWSGPPVIKEAIQAPSIKVRSFMLSDNLVKALLVRCRKEETTVTALMSVMIARRLAEIHPQYSRFTASIPFSLRKFTGHSPKDMGCYVSNIEPTFSAEEHTPRGYITCRSSSADSQEDVHLWEGARACKKFIVDQTSSPSNQNIGLLKLVSDLHQFFLKRLGGRREQAFEVTNIGVLDGGAGNPDPMKASFDQVHFSTGISTYAYPFGFCAASAKNGSLCVSLCWNQDVLTDEEAIGTINWLEDALVRLCSGS